MINAFFLFVEVGTDTYNATLSDQQNQSFTTVFNAQDDLESNINQTKQSVSNIQVQTGTTQFLWNSFQGLGSILKLPLTLVNVAINSATALIFGVEIVPLWSQTLLLALIAIIIILIILASMTGGNPNI